MDDSINHISPASPDFQTEFAAKLAEFAPEVVADGKIDIEKIRELLGNDGGGGALGERFGLFWPGKKQALRAAQSPTTATLKPDLESSKDWDTTKNVFIEGDNLEVLKVLQKHYHGKIKMIYIDPPYNTGKDFIYPDNYQEGLKTYLEWTQQVNEEGKKLSTNSESEGRYHSNWLNMMYPRLKLARNLLTDDGVIAVSIDDTELRNLQQMMIDIFGESNFYATVIWQKKYAPANDAKKFSDVHDYVVLFSRSQRFRRNLFPRTESMNKPYKYDDGDGRGRYRTGDLSVRTYSAANDYEVYNPVTGKSFSCPPGRSWAMKESSMLELINDNRVFWGKDGLGAPQLKRYLSEVQQGAVPTTFWDHEFAGHTDAARKEIKQLFDTSAVFDTPKNSKLIQRIIQVVTGVGSDGIVLDFFAGSATTAHAVMRQNAIDGGDRKFIQVQIPEPLAREVDGFETISDVAQERIRRAGEKIKQDFAEEIAKRDTPLDVGFRAYKLSDTNFTKWQMPSDTPVTELEQHLLDLRESADDDATADDLLTELLLKQGYSLTESIGSASIAGLELKTVLDLEGDVGVLAYLNEHIKPTLDQLREVTAARPIRLVILEDCFHGDDELKTNLVQMCKTHGIELWTA